MCRNDDIASFLNPRHVIAQRVSSGRSEGAIRTDEHPGRTKAREHPSQDGEEVLAYNSQRNPRGH